MEDPEDPNIDRHVKEIFQFNGNGWDTYPLKLENSRASHSIMEVNQEFVYEFCQERKKGIFYLYYH